MKEKEKEKIDSIHIINAATDPPAPPPGPPRSSSSSSGSTSYLPTSGDAQIGSKRDRAASGSSTNEGASTSDGPSPTLVSFLSERRESCFWGLARLFSLLFLLVCCFCFLGGGGGGAGCPGLRGGMEASFVILIGLTLHFLSFLGGGEIVSGVAGESGSARMPSCVCGLLLACDYFLRFFLFLLFFHCLQQRHMMSALRANTSSSAPAMATASSAVLMSGSNAQPVLSATQLLFLQHCVAHSGL